MHDEASEDAEESQQEEDVISEAEELSESEAEVGMLIASSEEVKEDSEGVEESAK